MTVQISGRCVECRGVLGEVFIVHRFVALCLDCALSDKYCKDALIRQLEATSQQPGASA